MKKEQTGQDVLRELREMQAAMTRQLEELNARLPLDLNRAYSDREVCQLLGGISRSTLWRIRKDGLLDTVDLYGGGAARTTGRQIAKYLEGRERAADVLRFTGTGRRRQSA